MLAYIDSKQDHSGFYYALVVTEDDYHNRGAFAFSFKATHMKSKEKAEQACKEWCKRNNIIITTPDDVAGE